MSTGTFDGFGLTGLYKAKEKHLKQVERLQRKNNPKPKILPRIIRDGSVKVVLIYSGKGGVGKTTTTANLAHTLLDSGHRVAIVDGDVNTPSMGVVFKKGAIPENLLVCSMGYEPGVFVQSSKVREFFRRSVKEVLAFSPDYLLIDTPPSITDVHLGMLETLKPTGLLLVTQPTELSWEDVSRTVWIFEQRQIPILGVVSNMVTDKSPELQIQYPVLAKILFDDSFDGRVVFSKNRAEYEKLADSIRAIDSIVLENRKKVLFDETGISSDTLPDNIFTFVNVGSWDKVCENLLRKVGVYRQNLCSNLSEDRWIVECTEEKVSRLVKAFEYDDEAYFMVTRAPNTSVHLIPGEIGRGRMRQHPGYYNIPCVDYHTSEGVVTLFPFECLPATDEHIRDNIRYGGKVLKDGRCLPGVSTVAEMFYLYGSRIGLSENLVDHYMFWSELSADEKAFLGLQESQNTTLETA